MSKETLIRYIPRLIRAQAGAAKAGPVVSDNGNFLVDAVFEQHRMVQPLKVGHKDKLQTHSDPVILAFA